MSLLAPMCTSIYSAVGVRGLVLNQLTTELEAGTGVKSGLAVCLCWQTARLV